MAWFWKRKTPPSTEVPRLVFEVHDGTAKVYCDYPEPKDDQDAERIATELCSLIIVLSDGALIPLIEQAVASAGVRKDSERLSTYVLSLINASLQKQATKTVKKGKKPAWSPTQIFED